MPKVLNVLPKILEDDAGMYLPVDMSYPWVV